MTSQMSHIRLGKAALRLPMEAFVGSRRVNTRALRIYPFFPKSYPEGEGLTAPSKSFLFQGAFEGGITRLSGGRGGRARDKGVKISICG